MPPLLRIVVHVACAAGALAPTEDALSEFIHGMRAGSVRWPDPGPPPPFKAFPWSDGRIVGQAALYNYQGVHAYQRGELQAAAHLFEQAVSLHLPLAANDVDAAGIVANYCGCLVEAADANLRLPAHQRDAIPWMLLKEARDLLRHALTELALPPVAAAR